MNKWDRNYVKLQDFIIFKWLKGKLGLQFTITVSIYTRQIYSDKFQNFVNIWLY